MQNGLVIKNTGSWYTVQTSDNQIITCKIKGIFRLQNIQTTNPIAVGDYVRVERTADSTYVIAELLTRKNYIIRRASNLSKQAHILAANLDLVALIVTVNYPETSTVFIDRFLATAEAYGITACLVFNKIDAFSAEETEYLENLIFLYQNIGYKTFKISALHPDTLNEFKEFITNQTTLLAGNSGVGKSTLINALDINRQVKTAQISTYHNKGVHTTTFSEMFRLPNGGYVIDTPGIKGLGTVDMKPSEVGHYFKEFFLFSKQCHFSNCTHVCEPDCAVQDAVKQHFISLSRYKSYLSVLSDAGEGKYR
ncbi:MAG: ribosome small subunit-dependent GTPase A [Prevotellaceae bacterium]|jgi:ribosome biogenesis GTPase|nr:ribosome small subunit-dependent GTPase A [Prevotellaceae bacterium]